MGQPRHYEGIVGNRRKAAELMRLPSEHIPVPVFFWSSVALLILPLQMWPGGGHVDAHRIMVRIAAM